ncbi:MAG TPA: DUF2783 domain-containing protein [Albitalea sp.]
MLITDPHLERPDDFYEALIAAHRGLDDAQSQALNARLVLLLANHIGSLEVLQEALSLARAGADDAAGEPRAAGR